jgi:ribonuclease P protein component
LAIAKTHRVKRSKDFDLIFGAKDSYANRKFVLYKKDTQGPHYRVGISVSKKLGNAVMRNRIKRLIRHALAEMSNHLNAEDFVIIARNGIQELTYEEIKQNLQHVLKLSKIYNNGEMD